VKVVSDPGRDGAVIYAGEDPLAAAAVSESVARETPGTRVVLPDAAVRNGVEDRLEGPAARRTVLVSSAPEPGSTPALRAFEAAFERAYRRRPGPYAALGHAAMETVLDALDRAAADDAAGRRSRVLREYFSGGARETVVGPLRLLGSGALASPRFTAFRLTDGHRGYLSKP
jgi:ABC-type branched-subunit amino acid transport system substrate-binding protein